MEVQQKDKSFISMHPKDYYALVKRRSKIMTILSFLVFGGLWVIIYCLNSFDPSETMYYYTSFFQIVLICGWCFVVYPYLSSSINILLYGIELNDKTADKISDIHEEIQPVVQDISKITHEVRENIELISKRIPNFKEELTNEIIPKARKELQILIEDVTGELEKFVLERIDRALGNVFEEGEEDVSEEQETVHSE